MIRLNAPIDELIPLAREFPSSEAAGGITQVSTSTLAESETQADLSLKDEAQGSDQAKGSCTLKRLRLPLMSKNVRRSQR